MVQPGWTVFDGHGEEIGKVIGSLGGPFTVRNNRMLGADYIVPRKSITAVETGHVETNLSRSEMSTTAG